MTLCIFSKVIQGKSKLRTKMVLYSLLTTLTVFNEEYFKTIIISEICILFYRYVDDLATIYHPERKSMLSSIKGFSLTIECLGGEVPFFYLSGKYIGTCIALYIAIIHITIHYRECRYSIENYITFNEIRENS